MDRNIDWMDVARNWVEVNIQTNGADAVVRDLAELLEEAYSDGYADGIEHED